MKIIKSSNKISLDILVDDLTYVWAKNCTWYVDNDGYARTGMSCFCKIPYLSIIYLHRAVMCEPADLVVDHINHNKLDNQEHNLRSCTIQQNCCNRSISKVGKSKYLGVYWHKKDKKWIARIKHNWISYWLGSYDNEIDAAKAYNQASAFYRGEFASLNIV